jgi:hypothetical protein
MPETPERLVERLSSEGQKTLEFFCALSPEQWDLKVYSTGSQWNARQVLAHFVSAETAFIVLMENILEGGKGAPENFDIDRFNEHEVACLDLATPAELLEQFAIQRQASTRLVGCMTSEDLPKVGRHPFLGEAPLEDIVKLLYRHNQIHQRDVRRMIS